MFYGSLTVLPVFLIFQISVVIIHVLFEDLTSRESWSTRTSDLLEKISRLQLPRKKGKSEIHA